MITEKHYKIAAKNGISRRALTTRVNSHKWDVKRAITQPMVTKAHLEKAKEIGITDAALHYRIRKGIPIEEACSVKRIKTIKTHDWDREIYALYKDDELIADGTVYEIAKKIFVSVRTVKYYQCNAAKARNKSGKRLELVYLGRDDEDEGDEW